MDQNVNIAAAQMHQTACDHMLVFKGNSLVGVLTEEDLKEADVVRSRFLSTEICPVDITVADVMTRKPICITPDTPMLAAIRLLKDKGIRCVPVTGVGAQIVGTLTQGDVLRYAILASQNLEVQNSRISTRLGILKERVSAFLELNVQRLAEKRDPHFKT